MKKAITLFLFSLISFSGFSASLTTISPAVSETGKTLMVTITGVNTHFSQATSSINFSQGSSTISIDNFNIIKISDTSLQAYITIPSNVYPGDYDINLYNAMDGNLSLLKGFRVNLGTSTALTSISPNVAMAGTTLTVTITGANTHFSQASSSINFSQGSSTIVATNSLNVINNTSIQADFTIPANANPGDYDINLFNAMDGNLSLLNGFHVNAGTSTALTSISPNVAKAGTTLTVTITGANTHFSQASSSINFSQGSRTIVSTNSMKVIDNTSIQADFTIPANANPGDYDINLLNAMDGNLSLLKGFRVNAGTSTALTSISPNVAKAGTTLTVTITGANTHFSQASSSINFSQGSSTIVSTNSMKVIDNTSIQADFTIPASANPGDYDINLFNAMDGNLSLLKGFRVNAGTSTSLTSISPNVAKAGTTLTVTITGANTHFSQASSSINFSQGSSTIVSTNSMKVINNTSIQADFTIPANAPVGNYAVCLSNLIDGNLSLAGGFKILNPALVSISPGVTNRNETLTVTITGIDTHFSQASNTINLVQGSNTILSNTVIVNSDTNIQASFTIASNANLGNYNVNLTNLVDGSLSLINGFTVKDRPSLVSISPAVSETGKSLTVTITGMNTHFIQGSNTVNLNQQSSNKVISPDLITVLNEGSIQANFTLPLNTSLGDYNVNVSNNVDENISILNGFHINQNTSSFILSATPGTATPGQTVTVTITGILTHFNLEDCTLNLTNGNNTILAASITKITDTSIQANFIIPLNAVTGYYVVNVSNSTDGTLTLSNGFQIGMPTLVSISPNSMAAINETFQVTITGAFTHFSQASNTIHLNQGSTVISANDHTVNVLSDTSIQAEFTILSTAALGPYDVNLTNLIDGSLSLIHGVTVVVIITGNENIHLNDLPVLTPNPVKDCFSFNKLNEKGTLTLYDLNNRLLLEKQISGSEKVYVSTLQNGIYIVKLVTNSGTSIQKVIKQ